MRSLGQLFSCNRLIRVCQWLHTDIWQFRAGWLRAGTLQLYVLCALFISCSHIYAHVYFSACTYWIHWLVSLLIMQLRGCWDHVDLARQHAWLHTRFPAPLHKCSYSQIIVTAVSSHALWDLGAESNLCIHAYVHFVKMRKVNWTGRFS